MELSEQGVTSLQIGGTVGPAAAVEYLQAGRKSLKKSMDKNNNNFVKKRLAITNSLHKSNVNSKQANKNNSKTFKCFRCGKGHFASQYTLSRDICCSGCGESGHLVKVCFKKKETANQLDEVLQLEHSDHRDKFFAHLL